MIWDIDSNNFGETKAMLRIQVSEDLEKLTEITGEEVEVMFDNLKGELSKRGYHGVRPGSAPRYQVWRKDIGHIDTARMDAERKMKSGG
jgi:hypothetical protein